MVTHGSSGAKGAPALPWMRVPIEIQPETAISISQVPGMDDRLKAALLQGDSHPPVTRLGATVPQCYTQLFPVQSVVWTELGGGLRTTHDLCIAAPTGSGKTLAYALPVINCLARQTSHRNQTGMAYKHQLQALVVLPTHDLAKQVATVMEPLCASVGLNLQVAAAQVSLSAEQDAILGHVGSQTAPISLGALTQPPGQQQAVMPTSRAAADVLIATPGRLMAHLKGTSGISLASLKFLVIDETDRLLRQSYQEWLPHVVALLGSPQHSAAIWQAALGLQGGPAAGSHVSGIPRCVKLVVSATLTRDPSKLQRLALHNPRYVSVTASDKRYQLPKGLQEYKLLCSAARKPLTLLALLQELKGQSCVVFASSLDTTHKLYLLLKSVLDEGAAEEQAQVVECSGHKAAAAQRAVALDRFRSGKASILVASDVVTRGMDFEDVQNVINYDTPVYAKTYVHRAGRTARAGKTGKVFTILKNQDVRHFRNMLRKTDNLSVPVYKLAAGAADALAVSLSSALQQVSALLAAEEEDDASRSKPAPHQSSSKKQKVAA